MTASTILVRTAGFPRVSKAGARDPCLQRPHPDSSERAPAGRRRSANGPDGDRATHGVGGHAPLALERANGDRRACARRSLSVRPRRDDLGRPRDHRHRHHDPVGRIEPLTSMSRPCSRAMSIRPSKACRRPQPRRHPPICGATARSCASGRRRRSPCSARTSPSWRCRSRTDVLDAGAFEVAPVRLIDLLAALLFGLVVGAWVDRLRRRPVTICRTSAGRAPADHPGRGDRRLADAAAAPARDLRRRHPVDALRCC